MIIKLLIRATGLINLDACVSGDVLVPYASASMKEVFYNAIRGVPAPSSDAVGRTKRETRMSYYEYLEDYYSKSNDPPVNITEKLKILPSGSDQDAFAYIAGIPSTYHKFM